MIIWGLKKKNISRETPFEMACPHCPGKEYTLSGLLRYLHIFWIPLFIVQKRVFATCAGCGDLMDKKSLPSSLNKEFKGIIFSTRHHLLYNFGIIVFTTIALSFALLVISMMGN